MTRLPHHYNNDDGATAAATTTTTTANMRRRNPHRIHSRSEQPAQRKAAQKVSASSASSFGTPSLPPPITTTKTATLSTTYQHQYNQHQSHYNNHNHNVRVVMVIVLLVGAATSAAFLTLGIQAARVEARERFRHEAREIAHALAMAWQEYEIFGLWIHQSCSREKILVAEEAFNDSDNEESSFATTSSSSSLAARLGYCSRREFRQLYEHVASVTHVDFQAIQYVPLTQHADRAAVEAEAAAYYATQYPNNTHLTAYPGITQLNKDDPHGPKFIPRTPQPFYWPIHYVEPVQDNEAAIDLDVYSLVHSQRPRIDKILATYQPAVSERRRLVQETDPHAYGIILQHPGLATGKKENQRQQPTALAQVVIRVPALIQTALASTVEVTQSIYIYDSTLSKASFSENAANDNVVPEPVFLGGAQVVVDSLDNHEDETDNEEDHHHHHPDEDSHGQSYSSSSSDDSSQTIRTIVSLPEMALDDIPRGDCSRYYSQDIQVSDRTWTIVVTSPEYNPSHVYVILGGVVILAACVLIAIHLHRVSKLHGIQSEAARMQVVKERQLNEFIAHEIRNPLSAALSALSFVSSGALDPTTHQDDQKKQCLEHDIQIMDASLHFISELLRNMLDVHRAESQQMKLDYKPTDVRRDVLEPVAAVLCMRGSQVTISVECPDDLVVNSDRMRLKQMILNLAANATKFVASGYIKLRGDVVNGSVQLSVEDSGPGIPEEKRRCLFAKFQDSLDSLAQGTGIGLAVCKLLSDLLGAEISLDEVFHSGLDGCPGTRFLLDLNQPPIDIDSKMERSGCTKDTEADGGESDLEEGAGFLEQEITPCSHDLPDNLTVLFTDDDMILRRMFIRALKRAAPGWKVCEASSGETALQLVDTETFDVIFMDQYMASVEKQMLGTDTVRALRTKGVNATIVGLSANDTADSFVEAGADHFMFKPFPFEKEALAAELLKILDLKQSNTALPRD